MDEYWQFLVVASILSIGAYLRQLWKLRGGLLGGLRITSWGDLIAAGCAAVLTVSVNAVIAGTILWLSYLIIFA